MSPVSPPPNEALKRPPSFDALQRVVEKIAPGASVVSVRRLKGGISMGMHVIRIARPDGSRDSLVLRRLNDYWHANDPLACEREFRTLEVLAKSGLSAPRPVWLDASGRAFGRPAMMTSLLPGRSTLKFGSRKPWVEELAAGLAGVHALDVGKLDLGFLSQQRDRIERQIARGPKRGALIRFPRSLALWDRLREIWPHCTEVPSTLLHGDYWAGNTLWRRGRLVGVADWEQASLGDPGEDVSYCRMDLALMLGGESPDEFLAAYRRVTAGGVPNLPVWDLVSATRALPDPAAFLPGYHELGREKTQLTVGLVRRRLARWIDQAVARAS